MSEAFYRSREWKALRSEVLRRQPTCTTPGCGARAVAVDHIQPRAKGGPDSLSNLRGLCLHHHNQRRRGGEPRVVGCDATGAPLDPAHWWNRETVLKNSSGLGPKDRSVVARKVSSWGRSDG